MDKIKDEEFLDHILFFIYCGICLISIITSIIILVSTLSCLFWIELSDHKLAFTIKKEKIQKIIKKYTILSGADSNIDIEKKKESFLLCFTLLFKFIFIFIVSILMIVTFITLFEITKNKFTENIQEIDFTGRRINEIMEMRLRLLEIEKNNHFLILMKI